MTCLSTVGCGLLAPTYPALLAWRFVGGFGGGVAFAAGASYTRGVFAGRGQHLAQGLYGASFLAGSASTLLYMPLLAGPGGDWRRAYAISGLAVLGIWAAWWRLAPAGPPRTATTTAGARSASGRPFAHATAGCWRAATCAASDSPWCWGPGW